MIEHQPEKKYEKFLNVLSTFNNLIRFKATLDLKAQFKEIIYE